MHKPVSWHEAREAARVTAKPLDPVELALDRALGTVLANPVLALTALPSFDNSAMDGFAVAGHGPWTVLGRVHAGGEPFPEALRPGQAVEIATGAPVPLGADTVLPVEHAERARDRVTGQVTPGRHIRRAGEDCPCGVELIPSGRPVTPALLGLAASVGYDTLVVHRRPRVAVLVTGDELVSAGPPPPGRVRDAIGPLLPGLVSAAGGELVASRQLPDQRPALADSLSTMDAEVLVVCGATSKGPADHLRGALRDLDADLVIASVACRPGHPQLLAVLPDGRCVVGLPGNPFAALAAVVTLLAPLVSGFGGHAPPPVTTARLTGDVTAHPRDTRLIPVLRAGDEAVPAGHDRPGTLWGAALADALAVVPPDWSRGRTELLILR
ncbi:molybdopterin molybdotransferase MoeA [Amycolatopsis sp. H20-H5]|uniref:molybdopterin molybdotransferase MoeA n=1 Tax=Amycolatopsis sp. H20-H5 TaxID=3046309 RepID=UPI002DB68510|nr:molybdopterin molybdotransferase MoeA [Amycolatopsis sp. H20-H5]MEC3980476.1 molybdopterin molybdotransferase MoeA [Amycolatopsis sp. H20-H5]